MSAYPKWSDDFEEKHPIIRPRTLSTEIELAHLQPEDPTIVRGRAATEDQHADQDNDAHNSEKIVIKSSNDTRRVNNDEDGRQFLFVENENKTENEYVFSENVNIDTLSYNEPMIEFKKKQEEEKENKGVSSTSAVAVNKEHID